MHAPPVSRLFHCRASVPFAARTLVFRLVADAEDGSLVACLPDNGDALRRIAVAFPDRELVEDAKSLALATDELRNYASKGREPQVDRFTAPLRLVGTPFQCRVWTELRTIPFGATRTYGEIATSLGLPCAARAVGQACRANPLLVFVPCHRVVGRDGRPRGYAGGADLQSALWTLEHP